MRLLDQRQIQALKVSEQTQEIDRGLKVAKRVDDLRAQKVKEEQEYEKWRVETLKEIQKQIDEAIKKRDSTLKEIEDAEIRLIKTNKATDVIELRERASKQAKASEKLLSELHSRETVLIGKELQNQVDAKDLYRRDIELKESQSLANQYIEETKIEYDKASHAHIEAKEAKDESDREIKSRQRELKLKKEDISLREKNLQNEREGLEFREHELEEEKLHIASQQETLKAAWQALNRLKK